MCGICGILSFNSTVDIDQLLSMTRVLRHRGPDDEGFILCNTRKGIVKSFHHDESIDEVKNKLPRLENNIKANLGFGFRRLSILDLTEHGHQPMQFEDAGLWIVFNGEIFNYIEIREELIKKGYVFKSNTDTEVILKSYYELGEECVNKFNGMWAFAIWDPKESKLFCSRDRFGIKPFYYNYKPGVHFIFASEIKSILQVIRPQPNYQTLYDYFYYGYSDHNERTFFEDIKQLRGGHKLVLQNGNLSIKRFYKINNLPISDSLKKSKEIIRELLFDTVKIMLRSDVPIGYTLSGGIDSSSIVCIASKINRSSNNTFSLIYPGENLDESFYIKKVIEKTSVNPHFVSPTSEDFLKDLDKFIWYQEEPFVGISYFGEFKLRELTRNNNVTVSLEGQGADEIFTGYTSLFRPYFFDLLSEFRWTQLLREYKLFHHYSGNLKQIVKAYIVNGKKISSGNLSRKYPYLNVEFFADISDHLDEFERFNSGSYLNDTLYEMLIYTSIPQQLVRADKNSMAFSVECRFPYLDYRLVEYAINLHYTYKIWNGLTKYVLREAIKDLLPLEVYNRKDKIGFAIPHNIFNNDIFKKHLYDLLNYILDENLQFINKQKFMDSYFSKSGGNELDWRFWKTISIIFWFNKFINIS